MKIINDIVNDTLKRKMHDGRLKWCRTSLTMLTAWILVIISYISDMIIHGFRWERFALMAGIAMGVKLTDAIAKKTHLNKEPEQ